MGFDAHSNKEWIERKSKPDPENHTEHPGGEKCSVDIQNRIAANWP